MTYKPTYEKTTGIHKLKGLLWGAEKMGMTVKEFNELYLTKNIRKDTCQFTKTTTALPIQKKPYLNN